MKLSEPQLAAALKFYGHSMTRVDFIESGYRNTSHIVEVSGGGLYNLIVYKNEPGVHQLIAHINLFSLHLRSSGIPVRYPVDSRILKMQNSVGTRYASLYSFERGSTIAWEMYSMKHIKLLGMAMGHFHSAAETYGGNLPVATMNYRRIVGRMERYFVDTSVSAAIASKLSLQVVFPYYKMRSWLDVLDTLPNQQPLHMDMVRGNVLFRPADDSDAFVVGGLALSGILDLERASIGHPIFDLARTHAFLLVDCPKSPEKIRKYLLNSGYQKRGGRTFRDILGGRDFDELYNKIIMLFLMYDFYKFLKQNPYESLVSNHHYIRTRDILLDRKMLQYK